MREDIVNRVVGTLMMCDDVSVSLVRVNGMVGVD